MGWVASWPMATTPVFGWTVLYVQNVDESIDLYVNAFNLSLKFRHPDGGYAEFDTGATTLAICDQSFVSETLGIDLASVNRVPNGNITLVVDDVATAYAHAVANGARAIHQPVEKPCGQTSSYVADLDGNLIEIATAVSP